jgi:SAM-dependent methyltransferase
MDDDWDDIAEWWIDAVRHDPAQSDDLLALLSEHLEGTAGRTIDLGCGEGQALPLLGERAVGVDLSERLLRRAATLRPVVRARLPDLSWARPGSFDRAVAVGVLDVIEDHGAFFENVAQVLRRGGHLIVVTNHPVVSAPGSEPLVDPLGEVLWRWGRYLEAGSWRQPVGGRSVRLQHRPLGALLTAAAKAGWHLEQMTERGPTADALAAFPAYRGQEHVPTVLGVRWRRG